MKIFANKIIKILLLLLISHPVIFIFDYFLHSCIPPDIQLNTLYIELYTKTTTFIDFLFFLHIVYLFTLFIQINTKKKNEKSSISRLSDS